MSVNEVNVIAQKLDDMKELLLDRINRLEEKVDGKCENCPTTIGLKERTSSQWWHIRAIWATISAVAFTVFGYLTR